MAWQQAVKEGKDYEVELRLREKDGELLLVSHAEPLRPR